MRSPADRLRGSGTLSRGGCGQPGTLEGAPSVARGQAGTGKAQLTPERAAILARLWTYYQTSLHKHAVLPFAMQLYYLADQWFNHSGKQGSFIDDAFENASKDVLTNPRYSSFENSELFYENSKNLAALGTQHLKDHIRPAYLKHLRAGIKAEMDGGATFKEAFRKTAHRLTAEHELFLTQAVPYGIARLKEHHILGKLFFGAEFYLGLDHVSLIQDNARGMRFSAAYDLLQEYVRNGQLSGADADSLVHEVDRSASGNR